MTTSTSSLQRSDFDLKPFMVSNNLLGFAQILSVLIPYAGLWVAAYQLRESQPWLLVPIAILMALFLTRSFSLMHDCGHYSLFKRARLNRSIGFLLGVINALPQYPWSRGHAFHHKHNGNWERYRGPAAVASVDEFAAMSPFRQRLYVMLRHPLMLFPGGFFYLIVKPRVQLLCGVIAYIPFFLSCVFRGNVREIFSYKSKFWYTNGEFWDILLNNICVISAWIICGEIMGHAFFWALYAPVMMMAAAIFICIFFIQHNYEESYAHRNEGWNYITGAMEGSSYLKMNGIFNWFTADIGYHNIHHLCERIPNYHLAACHRSNAELLANVKTLRLSDIPKCAGYILWDAEHDQLITVADYRKQLSA